MLTYSLDSPYPVLAQALWAWLIDFCGRLEHDHLTTTTCSDFFIRTAPDRFERVCRSQNIYDVRAAALNAFDPLVRAVEAAIRHEPELRDIAGTFYGGSYFDRFHVGARTFIDAVRPNDIVYERAASLAEPVAERIHELLVNLKQLIKTQVVEIEFVTPLWGLVSPTPIELEPGLVIDRITDEEVRRALEKHAIVGDLALHRIYDREPGRDLCLRRTIALPATAVARLPTPDEVQRLPLSEDAFAYDDVEGLLNVLPALAGGQVRPGGMMRWARLQPPFDRHDLTFGPANIQSLSDTRTFTSDVVLDATTAAQLPEYWHAVRALPAMTDVTVALRRFRYATQRVRDDDRILDLMIAAEVLFIPRGKDTDELRFRTAVNAAYFLSDSAAERRRVFELVRAGYDMRSSVAHGEEATPIKANGVVLTVRELLEALEPLLRCALQLRMHSTGEPVDWDLLTVGPR
jgi:hypothetical protein